MKAGILALMIALTSLAHPAYGSDPLPANRKLAGVGWAGLVGVPGGIPNRSTIYTTIAAGASASTIQTAMNSCPSNQVVLLGAGTYNLGGNTIQIRNNYNTLRLDPAAVITNGNIHINNNFVNDGAGLPLEMTSPANGNHTAWTGGYAQGTYNITVANTSGFSVGQIVVLDQTNDADTLGLSIDGYNDYDYTSVAYPAANGAGHDRWQYQFNRIAAITSPTNITLTEPLYAPYWSANNAPQIWRFSGQPIIYSGVEGGTVHGQINICLGYGCWVSNVTVYSAALHNGFIYPSWTVRCQVDHCTVRAYANAGGTDTYGIQTHSSSGILVQNNLVDNIGCGLMPNGSKGGVWAYNVLRGQIPGNIFMAPGLLQHGGFPEMNLYEGNYTPQIGMENTWSPSAYNVAFRNRVTGYDQDYNANEAGQIAALVEAWNRHASVIGNVLGTRNVHTAYWFAPGVCSNGNNNAAYSVGFFDFATFACGQSGCTAAGGVSVACTDSTTVATLLRAYNWTSATPTNGIAYDGYTGADIPASYYLSSKPSWFGSLAWPAVDPANPAYSGSFTNIPAGYRFVNGTDPSGGGVGAPPAAPQNLIAQ